MCLKDFWEEAAPSDLTLQPDEWRSGVQADAREFAARLETKTYSGSSQEKSWREIDLRLLRIWNNLYVLGRCRFTACERLNVSISDKLDWNDLPKAYTAMEEFSNLVTGYSLRKARYILPVSFPLSLQCS